MVLHFTRMKMHLVMQPAKGSTLANTWQSEIFLCVSEVSFERGGTRRLGWTEIKQQKRPVGLHRLTARRFLSQVLLFIHLLGVCVGVSACEC